MNLQKILFKSTNNFFLQLLRYGFVGGVAFAVDFGLLYILTEYVNLHFLLSATISFIAGLLINYFLSKRWVFNKSSVKNKSTEFWIFALIGIVGLGINNLFLWVFTIYVSVHYMASKIITTVIVFFWNFLARKYILFNTTDKQEK